MKITTLSLSIGGLTAGAILLASPAQANFLFAESFDTDVTANWQVNTTAGGAQAANFFFDYSTVGIPSAPNSVGGTTLGLKLQANLFGTTGAFPGGVSVSPLGQSFHGDYTLRFDMWMNFNGPMPGGGSGTTQAGGAGILAADTGVQAAGSTVGSLFFSTTVDGGSAVDYRVYGPAAQVGYTAESGVFAAGIHASARNNTDPYYVNSFAGQPAPAAQLALYPNQTGVAQDGVLAFAWRDVVIEKAGDIVTWTVDGVLLATVDITGQTFSGNNILFNHFDTNATASADPNSVPLLFTLIDNVRVIPEPTTASVLGLGLALLTMARRRR